MWGREVLLMEGPGHQKLKLLYLMYGPIIPHYQLKPFPFFDSLLFLQSQNWVSLEKKKHVRNIYRYEKTELSDKEHVVRGLEYS